jgi:hypothetical protein
MIKKLLEEYGIQFVNEIGCQWQRTNLTISLDTLERVERELRERLLQDLSWKAHCLKDEMEVEEAAGASTICRMIDNWVDENK